MLREIGEIAAAIPHGELAIQWDAAHEVQNLDGGRPHWFDDPEAQIVERLARLGNAIPAGIELGYHFCYGSFGHKHFVEPRDMGLMVRLANAVTRKLSRAIAWHHMPVPRDRSDDAYFAPLRGLEISGAKLFLGLIHLTDGAAGAQRRIDAARRFVPEFGVSTECGFGRRNPETTQALLELHAAVSDLHPRGPEEERMTTRREVLKFGAGTAALAVGAHTLGLDPAIAQVPAKIVIARLPINTIHTLYMGAGDWFKEEGLTVEYFMSPAGPAVVQALASGSVPVGEIGTGPAMISAARKLPFISPALGAIGTPKNPWQRIMVRKDSPIKTARGPQGQEGGCGTARHHV